MRQLWSLFIAVAMWSVSSAWADLAFESGDDFILRAREGWVGLYCSSYQGDHDKWMGKTFCESTQVYPQAYDRLVGTKHPDMTRLVLETHGHREEMIYQGARGRTHLFLLKEWLKDGNQDFRYQLLNENKQVLEEGTFRIYTDLDHAYFPDEDFHYWEAHDRWCGLPPRTEQVCGWFFGLEKRTLLPVLP